MACAKVSRPVVELNNNLKRQNPYTKHPIQYSSPSGTSCEWERLSIPILSLSTVPTIFFTSLLLSPHDPYDDLQAASRARQLNTHYRPATRYSPVHIHRAPIALLLATRSCDVALAIPSRDRANSTAP
jgi:hypothetical protein